MSMQDTYTMSLLDIQQLSVEFGAKSKTSGHAFRAVDGLDLQLNQGEVLALGTPAQVQAHPGVVDAYLGTAEDVSALRRMRA